MGHDSSSGPVVVYIDGQPIENRRPLPEFTADDISEDMKTARESLEAWTDIRMTVDITGDTSLFDEMELYTAICVAQCFRSTKTMARRYIHTKKKRTRKKYEKRIRAWFREVFL